MLPLESALARLASPDEPLSPLATFDPIPASSDDDLVLPDGFTYDVVMKWGDTFTTSGERFGFNNDFIGVFPLAGNDEALLWINHEYVSLATVSGSIDLYGQTFRMLRGHVPTVRDYKRDVGGSVLRVQRDAATGAWTPVLRDPLNRRVNAFTACRVDGPASRLMKVGVVEGTFENCAGGSPGDRAELRGEHPPARAGGNGYAAHQRRQFDGPGPPRLGGRSNSDPVGARRATALGRFRHEGWAAHRRPARRPWAHRIGGHVWKFVSAPQAA